MAASKKPFPRTSDPEVIHKSGKKSLHKRKKVSTSVPMEAVPVIDALRRRLKMSMAQLMNSLLAYAAWCEKDHALTGDAVRQGGAAERAMWAEIVRDFGKPDKTGSYFEHIVEERLLATMRKLKDQA